MKMSPAGAVQEAVAYGQYQDLQDFMLCLERSKSGQLVSEQFLCLN